MTAPNVTMAVRSPSAKVAVIDIRGEVTSQAEDVLMDAYTQATSQGPQVIILNFEGLQYMNSSGIGLLVTVLIRTQRQKQKLVAIHLSDHYQQIFELTRLNEAISIYSSEAEAMAAMGK